MIWDPRVFTLDNLLVKSLHIVGSEWWIQCAHLVEYAAEGPYVTLRVVWHVAPDFGTCVVWRSRLCVTETFLDNLGDIEIAEFGLHIAVEKYIGTLHISVQDFPVVQCFQSANYLNEYVPYFLFFDVCLSLLIATYFLEDIAVVSVLHDETVR